MVRSIARPAALLAALFGPLLLGSALLGPAAGAAEGPPGPWQDWEAHNEISNTASLQRGASAFMNYCVACHSLKYKRYSRLGEDLDIPLEQLEANIVLPGDKRSDYIKTSLAAEDGEAWFGKAPPDLSLIARSKGPDYVYRFLKSYYLNPNPSSVTGVDNLQLSGTAMPHVLASLGGVPEAVFRNIERKGAGGEIVADREFVEFKPAIAGTLSAEQYDEFVLDIVNFLDYVGEPAQLVRKSLGVWVILFLMLFTGIAFLLKQEYWKDVK